MTDSLGFRKKFGVVAPSTNTSVQPEFDAMRPRGVTNHFGRIHIPNDPVRNDVEKLNEMVYESLFLTPGSDPWLGLFSPEVYTALDNGGVTKP